MEGMRMVNGYLVPPQGGEMVKSLGWGGDFAAPGIAPDAMELLKTLTAGNYQTDVASLSGGEAVRIESLDRVLKALTIEMDDFKLWHDLRTDGAGAIVDQWIEKGQDSIARFPGSGFNSETGTIDTHSANYLRRTAEVKYLMTMRSISMVMLSQKNVIDVEADENINATLELLQSIEWASFYGNAAVNPEEFNGLEKTLETLAPGNIIDLNGRSDVEELYQKINSLAAKVREHSNFGILTDAYHGTQVQNDLDQFLTPGHRVSLTNAAQDILLGAPVRGIQTSYGPINMKPDIFTGLRYRQIPMEASSAVGANAPGEPTSVAVTDAGPTAGSMFTTDQAGAYTYVVASVNKNGESNVQDGDQSVTIDAGDAIQLVITDSSAVDETGYAIYRSRMDVDPGTDYTEYRLVRRIAYGAGTTTWVDKNEFVPGTETIFLVNNKKALDAIGFRQLAALSKFPLYPTNALVRPFAYFLFGYLRITKALQHAMIRNYLPTSAEWKPFG